MSLEHWANRFHTLKSDLNLRWVSLGCFNYSKFTGETPTGKTPFQKRVINTKLLGMEGAPHLPGPASWEPLITDPQACREELS